MGEGGDIVVGLFVLAFLLPFVLLVSAAAVLASFLLVLAGLVEVAAGVLALLDDVAGLLAFEAKGRLVA